MSDNSRKAVSKVVQEILANGRASRADGPNSNLYGRDAQLAAALSKAGLTLAKLDRGGLPAKRPSALQGVLNAIVGSSKPKAKRSWFFTSAAATSGMPDAKRIDELLKAAQKDGARLSLDLFDGRETGNEDLACHLPEGAVDPVCEPRR